MSRPLIPELRFPEFKDAPPWEMKRLGDVASVTTGASNKQDCVENGPYVFFDRSKETLRSRRYLFDTEALILPGEGQTFTPKYFQGKFDLHQRAYAIYDFKDCLGKFLLYALTRAESYLLAQAVGSTVKSMRLPIVVNAPISIPSLAEQEKIAGCLSSMDDVIAAAASQLEHYRLYKKGLLQKLFPAPLKEAAA